MTNHIINVLTATKTGDCVLSLEFDDGGKKTVDFKPFLQRSLHPEIRAYLDSSNFSKFRIEHGEIVWGDYDLCFPIMDLYNNQIDRFHPMQAAA